MKNEAYLGDGVYAAIVERSEMMVELTTKNGVGTTNTIYLDIRTCVALMDFIDGHIDRGPAKEEK